MNTMQYPNQEDYPIQVQLGYNHYEVFTSDGKTYELPINVLTIDNPDVCLNVKVLHNICLGFIRLHEDEGVHSDTKTDISSMDDFLDEPFYGFDMLRVWGLEYKWYSESRDAEYENRRMGFGVR